MLYGYVAYQREQTPANLKVFFSDAANVKYLTLYDHMFTYDGEKSIPIAEELFRFILENYGKEALLDRQARITYKNAYLESLGLTPAYLQTPEVESFFMKMKFSSNATYPYIMTFDNVTYYFKALDKGTISQYHSLLYYNTVGLETMIGYLQDIQSIDAFTTAREFDYYMFTTQNSYSMTAYPSGNMYISDFSTGLHEAVHAMGIRLKDHIWLSEGICEYLGKGLGFNDQIAVSHLQTLTMVGQGALDSYAAEGDASAIFYKSLYEKYTNAGGILDTVDAFDLRLYYDAYAKTELENGRFSTLGENHEAINQAPCVALGKELSYAQANSLIAYLAEQYGLNRVIEAYQSQDIEGVFGKNYEGLKSDWMAYLGTEY